MSQDDPFHSHQRKTSLATVYEDNDPYRTARRSPRHGSFSDNSDYTAFHSRTGSDSSTSRLYTGAIPLSSSIPTAAYDDPYTKDFYNKKWRAPRIIESERANSYLPYSHHQRDPNQKPADIYIEDEAPHSSTLGVGSFLQDNYIDHVESIHNSREQTSARDQEKLEALPAIKKRKERRCCGLRYRTIVFLALVFIAIVIVIWYFVWPRIPTLSLDDIDVKNQTKIPTKSAQKSISATWLVNISADNSVNWVPTRISNWEVTVIDDATQKQFGRGTTGSFVLPPKKSSIVNFEMEIYYETDNENDTTFQDLYSACGLQPQITMGTQTKQSSLNATFYITHHIAGIAWTKVTTILANQLLCPN